MLEAVGRVDYDAAMQLVHPQIELVPPGAQAPRKGAGRFRQWLEPDAFAEQVIQPLAETRAGWESVSITRRPTGRRWLS